MLMKGVGVGQGGGHTAVEGAVVRRLPGLRATDRDACVSPGRHQWLPALDRWWQ